MNALDFMHAEFEKLWPTIKSSLEDYSFVPPDKTAARLGFVFGVSNADVIKAHQEKLIQQQKYEVT